MSIGRSDRGLEKVSPHVRGDDIEVVVESAGTVLDLEELVSGMRVRIRSSIHHLSAVHREPARVLWVRSLVRHQDSQSADLGVRNGIEGVVLDARGTSHLGFNFPIVLR